MRSIIKPGQSHLQQNKEPNQEIHLQNEELFKHQDWVEYFGKFNNLNRDSVSEICDQTDILEKNVIRYSQKNSEKIKNTGNSNKDTEELTGVSNGEQKPDSLKEENDDEIDMTIPPEEDDNKDEEKKGKFESNNNTQVKNENKIPEKDADKIKKKDENKIHEKKEEKNSDDEIKISDCSEEEDDEIEDENTIKNDQPNPLDEYLIKDMSSGDKNDNFNVFREHGLKNPENDKDNNDKIEDNCNYFQSNGNLSKKRKR